MTDEKPIAIILPSWNPDEPRFIVKECPRCSEDRQFKNNKCIYNQRLRFCYSAEEIVEVLNNINNETDKLKQRLTDKDHLLTKQLKVNENLQQAIRDIDQICNKYHIKLEDVAETLEEYICLDNGEQL